MTAPIVIGNPFPALEDPAVREDIAQRLAGREIDRMASAAGRDYARPTVDVSVPWPDNQQNQQMMLLLAGTIYAMELGTAEVIGYSLDVTSWHDRQRNPRMRPYRVSLSLGSDDAPHVYGITTNDEQAMWCERVSQWFAQRAIDLGKKGP